MTRLLWAADTLREAGLTVYEYPGWEQTGRDAMTPAGFVWHHTATSTRWSDWNVAQLLARGRRDLPGPLSQFGLDRTGKWWVIASGVANHAGRGGWQGLEGNHTVLGLEVFNDGVGERWTRAQYDSAVRGTAALMARLNRNPAWLCGHKEWTSRKIDPAGIDMSKARIDVERAMNPEKDDMPRYVRIKGDRRLFVAYPHELVSISYDVYKQAGAWFAGRKLWDSQDITELPPDHPVAQLPKR